MLCHSDTVCVRKCHLCGLVTSTVRSFTMHMYDVHREVAD